MNLKHIFSLLLVAGLLGLAACGGDTQPQAPSATTDEAPSATTETPASSLPPAVLEGDEAEVTTTPDGVATLRIHPVGEEMKYAETRFTVEAGQTVHLTFENTATSPAMHHNVVILTSTNSEDVTRVGQAALAEADHIPEDDAILAYTEMAAPQETVEVTFTAPDEPGDYLYICTYPGHYMVMQGVMHVVEPS